MLCNKQVIVLCFAMFVSWVQARPDGWKYEELGNLANAGIYTQKQIDEARKQGWFPNQQSAERPPVPVTTELRQERLLPMGIAVSRNVDMSQNCSCSRTWDEFIVCGTVCAVIVSVYLCLKIIELAVKAVYGLLILRRQRALESNVHDVTEVQTLEAEKTGDLQK